MTRRERLTLAATEAVDAQEAALRLKQAGRLMWVADDGDCPNVMRLAALAEELGEVARCIHDNDVDSLRMELSQLAGIAIAWASIQ